MPQATPAPPLDPVCCGADINLKIIYSMRPAMQFCVSIVTLAAQNSLLAA